MDNLLTKRKHLSGKNKSSPDSSSTRILRSACTAYDCVANSSTSSVAGSPVRALRSPKECRHIHQHHLHAHHHSHLNHHQQHPLNQNERVLNWVNGDSRQAHSFEAQAKSVKAKNLEEVHALSNHSHIYLDSDVDEAIKTDYTYAESVSYSNRITPSRVCPSPNMSRTQLRRVKQSHSLGSSDEDVETKENLLKLQNKLFVDGRFIRTSTPNFMESNVLLENKFTTTRTHMQENEDEFLSSSNLGKEWPSFHSQASFEGHTSRLLYYIIWLWSSFFHSLYAFVCTMMHADVWLLSSCQSLRSSRSWKTLLLLCLPLLLPLLVWQLSDSSFRPNVLGLLNKNNYLSALRNSEEGLQVASEKEASRLIVPVIIESTGDQVLLLSQWEKLLEQKLREERERMLPVEMEKILQQQSLHLDLILNVSAKIASLEADRETVTAEAQAWTVKRQESLAALTSQSQNLVKEMSDLKLKLEAKHSSSADTVQLLGSRLKEIEKRQQVLEDLVLTVKNCCKKQESQLAGVSQADLDVQLSSLVQEIRSNLSQLSLLHSASARASDHPLDVPGGSSGYLDSQRVNSSVQCPSLNEVQHMVRKAISIYDADKTGLVDYALESAGGSIISTRCTETYSLGAAQFSLFGVPFWYSANTPRTVIQPQVHPGECWAMRGTQGYLVILLSASVRPTAFSLEHIPKELSPTGKIDSAPKEFSVFGLASEEDTDGRLLGTFTYLEGEEPLQKFAVQDSNPGAFSVVELRIHSNHGNPDYTCLYRFRVHGLRQ